MKPRKRLQVGTLAGMALFALWVAVPCETSGQIPFHLEQSKTKVLPVKNLSSQVEDALFGFTNAKRAKKKLPPLVEENLLAGIARAHSQDMLKRNYLSHFSPERKSVVDRYARQTGEKTVRRSLGENLHTIESSQGLRDPSAIAEVMIQDWMNSSSHRRNVLSKDYRYAGVGCASDGTRIFCTEVFGGEKH